MNFIESTNEELVGIVQDGNDTYGFAYREIADRYEPRIRSLAKGAHAKNTRISLEDWESHYRETLWEAVRKFDVQNEHGMLFEPYLFWKLKKRAFDYVRRTLYVRDHEPKATHLKPELASASLDDRAEDVYEDGYNAIKDPRSNIEVVWKETNTELFAFIRTKSIEHAEFLEWKLAGYEYREIAAKMGRVGTPNALRDWGKRMTQRIQQIVIEFYRQSKLLDELSAYVGQQIMERLQNGLTVGQRELSSLA